MVESVVELFRSTFTKMKESFHKKKENVTEEEILKNSSTNLTQPELNTSRLAMLSALPASLPQSRKQKFTGSVLELVQSTEFLDELDNRIKQVNIEEADMYIEQCSLLMRQLLTEMILEKKL
ncbi:hypothetical protein F4826_000500 [Rahnella inusitata]|nr:hypothetical protein [Rahnella inusitata]